MNSPLFHHAIVASSLNDVTTAYNALQAEVVANPTNAEAWHMLGHLLSEHTKHYEAAAAAFSRANQLRPCQHKTLVGLGWSLHLAGHDEAIQFIEDAVALERTPLALADLAALLIGEQALDRAIDLAKEAVSKAPDLPLAHMVLAFAHFHRQEWLAGFNEYEWRFRYKMPAVLNYPYPLWRGERVDTLFVTAEQGIGDTIQALRWLPHVYDRVKKVRLFVHPQLRTLVQQSFPDQTVEPSGTPLPPADAWIPLFSLPVALNIDPLADPPWLAGGRSWVSEYCLARDDTTIKIGICWAGNPEHDQAHYRDVGLKPFLQLARNPQIELHSLQIGQRVNDINDIGAAGLVRDASLYIGTMQDTAAYLLKLDSLITCDTAIAHLGGSIGIPTTLLVNQRSVDWRWGMSGHTNAWYPSMHIVRCQRSETWYDCLDNCIIRS